MSIDSEPQQHGVQVLGGVVLPAGYDVAMQRLLSVAMLADIADTDSGWAFTEMMALHPGVPGKRIWWRKRYEDGDEVFVCNDPGEFRTEEPRDPDDLVLDPPTDLRRSAFSDLLRSAIACEFAPPTTAADNWRRHAERVLAEGQSRSYAAGAKLFSEEMRNVRQDVVANQQSAVDRLHSECLFGFQMPVTRFVPAMLLLQLQCSMGQYIDADCDYSEAASFLNGFVRRMVSLNRERLARVFEKAVTVEYRGGKQQLQRALDASGQVEFARHLLHAATQFHAAHRIIRMNDQWDVGASLPYEEVLADEGYACASAGLKGGVEFFLTRPSTSRAALRARLASDGWSDYPSLAELSSPIHPVHLTRCTPAGLRDCCSPVRAPKMTTMARRRQFVNFMNSSTSSAPARVSNRAG
jgi:hypothetical protein